MFTRKLQMPQHGMPAAEEFALWGARELSFEELLAVNGGKREKKEKSSGRSTSSGSSGGSSGSSHRRASSGTDSSTKDSSKSKEKKNKKPNTPSDSSAFDEKKSKPPVQSGTPSVNSSNAGESKKEEEKQGGSADYTVQKGDTLSGIIRQRYPGASKEEIVRRVKEAAANSGITDIDKIEPGQKIVFEKPAPPSERPNEGEKNPPTQGGGFPRERWGRPSSGGGVSGSTGGSSGNSSGGESSGRGSSGGGNTDSGGSARFNGRRSGGGDWQEGKNPRMPPGWGTKEKQHTEGQEKDRNAGADFAMPQEKRGFLAGLKERFNRGSKDGAGEIWNSITKWHYEGRKTKNINLPSYDNVIHDKKNWTQVDERMAKYHQNKEGSPELKFTNKDGREAVYTSDFSSDGSYELYTDPRYEGTYNYVTPSALPSAPDSITDFKGIGDFITDGSKFLVTGAGHFLCDMLPYYALGCER